MAFLQELTAEELRKAVEDLADGNLCVALTVRYQSRWVTFRSYAIAEFRNFLWVEMPKTDHLPTPY